MATNESVAEATLKKLVGKRGVLKATLTKFEKFINDGNNKNKLMEIRERISKIEKVFDSFSRIQEDIELIDQSGGQTVERDEFEDKYFAIVATARQLIKDNENQGRTTPSSLPLNNVVLQSTPQINYQLPPISLPYFEGAYDKWSTFFDTFKSLIHNNQNLVTVQKFHYLKSSLRSEALKVIESLEVNELNYTIALELLIKRFENKKLVINGHVKGIFEITPINKESHQALRTFIDTFQRHYQCLLNLGEQIDQSSTMLIYLLLSKLDNCTKKEWQIKNKDVISPRIDKFLEFLNERCLVLESIYTGSNKTAQVKAVHVTTNKFFCLICKSNNHGIAYCEKFIEKDPPARLRLIRQLDLCLNCLRRGHNSGSCKAKTCKYCGKNHHSMLHFKTESQTTNRQQNSGPEQIDQKVADEATTLINTQEVQAPPKKENPLHVACSSVSRDVALHENNYTFISTAMVYVNDYYGRSINCRVLLDNASQSSFISQELFVRLGIPFKRVNIPIMGINASISTVDKLVNVKMHSRVNDETFSVPLLVIEKITEELPQQTIDITGFNIPSDLSLADPEYYLPSKIDILLGNNIFYDLLLPKQVRLGPRLPILQLTKLGYVVAGNFAITCTPQKVVCNLARSEDLNSLNESLIKFWSIEECLEKECSYSQEEIDCEQHFIKTVRRNQDGKFVVSLPFKDIFNRLGDSLTVAQSRLQSLERRLKKNSSLKLEYASFLKEYLELGHMSLVKPPVGYDFNTYYYMPHHCVCKESSNTTKLRVVFNASSKSKSNLSLNDVLKTGPSIQPLLFSTLLRFRTHLIAVTADITKMYRCILTKNKEIIKGFCGVKTPKINWSIIG